jgi:parvulin-like peptidyl-prolyl isomerase
MSDKTFSHEEIIYQLKLSGQMPVILEAIAARHAIAKAAAKAGIKVEVEELQQAADRFRAANNLELEKDTWQWLHKQGMSLDEFEQMLEATILGGKLAQHLFADKVEPYFVENHPNYTQVVMYEVILDDEDLARELFYSLQEGELNFHAVAHQYNSDEQLQRTGGYRGLLRRQDLKPEISAAVFAAKPPQLLKPIMTAKGVHLILVEEIVQTQLDDALKQQILFDLFDKWVKQQVEKSDLTTAVEALSVTG